MFSITLNLGCFIPPLASTSAKDVSSQEVSMDKMIITYILVTGNWQSVNSEL